MADVLYPWLDPQELGVLGSSVQGPLELTAQMGAHANWDKFLAEARRSTNVEDNRAAGEEMQRQLANEEIWKKVLRAIMPGGSVDSSFENILYK